MTTSAPVVDVAAKTVTHEGKTFTMEDRADGSFNILVGGAPVGRAVHMFGEAKGSAERDGGVSEDTLTAVAESWFAALDAQ
jgi:hypothetical protein